MNPRMPYYSPASATEYHHNGYGSNHNKNDMHMDPGSGNWDRYNWKRNRNRPQPYFVPKKQFTPRFQRNSRYDNGSNSYYDMNGHQGNWAQPHKSKSVKSDEKDPEQTIPGTVANKKKRKPMSKSYPSSKWDEKDAEKALQAEQDFTKNLKSQSLIIRFPDPELSKDIVQNFHPQIESVHFPQASTPRYCFAHLSETADINKVVTALEKIPFGQGFLSVDIKKAREESSKVAPKDIDPYTLYVGNLPMSVTKQGVIQKYPGCTRIDIGHPQQMKNTRYAFVRFSNVDDAIVAYKTTRNTQFESRSLIVRFRRINGNVGVPGESKQPNLAPKTKTETPQAAVHAASTVTSQGKSGEGAVTATQSAGQGSVGPQVPDLNLVKEEPTSDNEECFDVKPDIKAVNGLDVVVKKEIKTEALNNEDEVEHAEEEEEYLNDNFHYMEEGMQDECDDYEDEDDYDDEEEPGLDLDLNDTFLPDDDDEDIFNGDG